VQLRSSAEVVEGFIQVSVRQKKVRVVSVNDIRQSSRRTGWRIERMLSVQTV